MRTTRVAAAALLFAASACVAVPVRPDASPRPVTAATVDRAAVRSQLGKAASLTVAAADCASALRVPVTDVTAAVQAPDAESRCVTCYRPAPGGAEQGAALAGVAMPLLPGTTVRLIVGDVTCIYLFDGDNYRPASVVVR
jgi:hypothetical protein